MSLQPVYKVLKENDHDFEMQRIEIESQDSNGTESRSESNSSTAVPPSASAQKCANASDKCCNKPCQKASIARRICHCMCGLMLVSVLLWIAGGAAVMSYVGLRTYRCLNPRYAEVTQYSFSESEISGFDLSVVSGRIDVHTCPKADKIVLRITNRASSPALLKTMPVMKKIVNQVLTLSVLAPSFDMHNCQHTDVMLVIPERLAGKHKLTLNAKTILGKIDVNAPKHTFEKVNLFANVGLVHASNVKVEGPFEAITKVGQISAHNVHAKAAYARAIVGSVDAHGIGAREVAVVSLDTGRAHLSSFNAPTVAISSKIAWISAFGTKASHLEANVDYGRLHVITPPSWEGQFSVNSPYGFIEVTHAHNVKAPKLEQNTPAIISGSFNNSHNVKKAEKPNVITLQAQYAALSLSVPK